MVYQSVPPKTSVSTSDDAFHILRDCRALYLKQLGQLLQEAERVPASAVQVFQQSVGDYFDEMVAARRRSGFNEASGLTASRISLVGENDLELEIRLSNFTARLMERIGADLWPVYLRFATLLNRSDLNPADNPVGPKGIAVGLLEFCNKLGENHEQTMARVSQLEIYFSQYLSIVYNSVNDFLAKRHVETALPSIITAPEAPVPGAAAATVPNPAAALQKSLLGPSSEFFAFEAGQSASLASLAMQKRLLARLDELERSGKLAPNPHSNLSLTATHPSLEALIPGLFSSDRNDNLAPPQALNSSELGIPTGAPEAASIDALALIFETIFASPILPEAIKTALSSLQIPLLKAALLDSGFFTGQNHPARQLLDKIARAALGLPLDISPENPVCSRIRTIATQVRTEFTDDLQVFERHIGELDSLIAERDATVAGSAEAYAPLLHQVERHNQAKRRCQQAIEQHLTQETPDRIATFLRTYWQKVLLVVWLERGEQSSAWQENNALVKDLLWSILPKTDMEERKQLAKMLQPMVLRLNAGMARIEVPEEVQTAFLDACFELQSAAMRGTAGQTAARTETALPNSAASVQEFSELSSGKLLLKIFDQAEAGPNSARTRPAPVRPGSWLLFSLPDTPPLCGRLCTGSLDSKLQLIANPDWGFAVALHPERLENMLATGAARVCSRDSLFDRAAEKALQRTAKP